MEKEEIKLYWLVALLGFIGAFIGLGKLLQSSEKITARLLFGRIIVSASLGMSVLVALQFYPDISVEALIGAAIVVGVMGEQGIEMVINKFLGNNKK